MVPPFYFMEFSYNSLNVGEVAQLIRDKVPGQDVVINNLGEIVVGRTTLKSGVTYLITEVNGEFELYRKVGFGVTHRETPAVVVKPKSDSWGSRYAALYADKGKALPDTGKLESGSNEATQPAFEVV